MKDWQVRALKTFAQCFGGVLVPEIVILLNNLPADIDTAWKILFPVICAAVGAGIAAVWNIILEQLKKGTKEEEPRHDGGVNNIFMTYEDYIGGNGDGSENNSRQD